jgi:uncharacterized protein YbaP (TraB family)
LQRRLEKDVKKLKYEMKKDLEKEREQHRIDPQNVRVRFPWYMTNVYCSKFIQTSAVLMSSDSLPKFTSL